MLSDALCGRLIGCVWMSKRSREGQHGLRRKRTGCFRMASAKLSIDWDWGLVAVSWTDYGGALGAATARSSLAAASEGSSSKGSV
jgi:hypothetical protein